MEKKLDKKTEKWFKSLMDAIKFVLHNQDDLKNIEDNKKATAEIERIKKEAYALFYELSDAQKTKEILKLLDSNEKELEKFIGKRPSKKIPVKKVAAKKIAAKKKPKTATTKSK